MESEAILALAAVVASLAVSLSWTPIGKALIDRLRRPQPVAGAEEELHEEIDRLHQRVAELEERVDFAERTRLGPPR